MSMKISVATADYNSTILAPERKEKPVACPRWRQGKPALSLTYLPCLNIYLTHGHTRAFGKPALAGGRDQGANRAIEQGAWRCARQGGGIVGCAEQKRRDERVRAKKDRRRAESTMGEAAKTQAGECFGQDRSQIQDKENEPGCQKETFGEAKGLLGEKESRR